MTSHVTLSLVAFVELLFISTEKRRDSIERRRERKPLNEITTTD